jgi:hypothetical protein
VRRCERVKIPSVPKVSSVHQIYMDVGNGGHEWPVNVPINTGISAVHGGQINGHPHDLTALRSYESAHLVDVLDFSS